jgi:MraZ protein
VGGTGAREGELSKVFYGEYRHTVDDKCRLSIPARFRAILLGDDGETCYLTRGLDRCLLLCTRDYWQKLEARFAKHVLTNRAARAFKRAFYSGANPSTFDRQGRIAIPQNLLDYAGIKRDVVIVGVSEAIEIWDAALYEEAMSGILENFGEAAQALEEQRGEN